MNGKRDLSAGTLVSGAEFCRQAGNAMRVFGILAAQRAACRTVIDSRRGPVVRPIPPGWSWRRRPIERRAAPIAIGTGVHPSIGSISGPSVGPTADRSVPGWLAAAFQYPATMESQMSVSHFVGTTARLACAALLLASLLAGCKPEPVPVKQPRAVNVVRIGTSDTVFGNSYSGDVRARYETALGFRVGGKITERLVDVGDTVKKGQVLLRLDPLDQRLGVEAASQQMAAAEANLAQTRADLVRFRELARQGFISAAELDRRKAAFDVADAQMAQARAQWSLQRNQTDYTALRADHDGIVAVLQAEVGQVVDRGTVVLRLIRPGEREVAISVPENRLREVIRGREASVILWTDPSRVYKGRVREVAPGADAITRTYAAKVSIVDADDAVQWGMTANVAVAGNADAARAVKLPSSAIHQKGDQAAVWIVDPKTSQVSLHPVRIDRFADEYVAVLEGVKPGDAVVRAGVHRLFDGETVRILAEVAR
jgi:multidrug efflux system membrane fusion protein